MILTVDMILAKNDHKIKRYKNSNQNYQTYIFTFNGSAPRHQNKDTVYIVRVKVNLAMFKLCLNTFFNIKHAEFCSKIYITRNSCIYDHLR